MTGAEPVLRPVTPADEPFLREVYAGTRAAELERVAWTDEQKREFVDMQFRAQSEAYAQYTDTTFDVIELDGVAVGRLYVARNDEEIRIVDIALHPDHQGRGVGTVLLRRLIGEAAAAGRPLRIHVERENPARRLYDRLGFEPTADEVSGGIYVRMERLPG